MQYTEHRNTQLCVCVCCIVTFVHKERRPYESQEQLCVGVCVSVCVCVCVNRASGRDRSVHRVIRVSGGSALSDSDDNRVTSD